MRTRRSDRRRSKWIGGAANAELLNEAFYARGNTPRTDNRSPVPMIEQHQETTMFSDSDDLNRAIEALSEAYPRAFFVNGRLRRPLKNHIVRDIKTAIAKDPNSELRFYDIDDAVDWYQRHVGYNIACSTPGTARLDLDGNRVGTVTEAEARMAGERAKTGFEQIEARKRLMNDRVTSASVNVPLAVRALRVDTSMNDDALLTAIEKHLASLRAVLMGDLVDSSLRKELARPVLLLLIDELKTLDARLTA
jgi:sRNA-binding protein